MSALFTLSVLVTGSSHVVQAASTQELKGVTSEISRQKQSLSSQTKTLDKLQASLKNQELNIAALEKKIAATKKTLSVSNQHIDELKKKIKALEEQKLAQSERLKALLHTYYITQNSHSATAFLKDTGNDDRMSQYYQHLAKARSDVIKDLEKTQNDLHNNENKLEQERQQITALLEDQTKRHKSLQASQSNRRSTVNKIRHKISSDKVYLAELQRNESRLKAEIAKAAKRNTVLMNGISKEKGKLPWPLKGKVLHRFGTRQSGQITWKGLVIDANYGQEVKAVYSGRVVFSEYLRGYGLVVLLDHGKGDMTLYGFNQSLLKKEGDKVHAGETIALAGDTGGQPQPSLYFEIRRNSRAENPISWLSR